MITKRYYCDCCGKLMFNEEYNEKEVQPFTVIFQVNRKIHIKRHEQSYIELDKPIDFINVCESCYKDLDTLFNEFYDNIIKYSSDRKLSLQSSENNKGDKDENN